MSASLQLQNQVIDLSNVKAVWYRNPVTLGINADLKGMSRELAMNETLEAIHGFYSLIDAVWINDPIATHLAHNKIQQLKIAQQSGFKIPRSIITNIPAKVREFYSDCNGKIVIKQLARNFILRRNKTYGILTNLVKETHLKNLNNVILAPSFFQEYVSKKLELRITIVGKKIFSVAIYSQNSKKTSTDWRRYDLKNTPHIMYDLPKDIEKKCLNMMKKSKLVFAAIDLILTPNDEYVFLDINPHGGWLWMENLIHLPITSTLVKLLSSLESH